MTIHTVRVCRDRQTYDRLMADDPILKAGEFAFVYDVPDTDTTSDWLKIGDGKRRFSELPWYQDVTKIPLAQKGAPNGLAVLDGNGRVPLELIPEDRRIPIETPVVMSCTYTGEPQRPSVYVSDPYGQVLTGDLQATEAGVYRVAAKPTSNHVWADGTTDTKYLEWEILPEPLPFPVMAMPLKYNGMVQTPIWVNFDPAKMVLEGELYAMKPGAYVVTFILEPGYVWEDGTREPVTMIWKIEENEPDEEGDE